MNLKICHLPLSPIFVTYPCHANLKFCHSGIKILSPTPVTVSRFNAGRFKALRISLSRLSRHFKKRNAQDMTLANLFPNSQMLKEKTVKRNRHTIRENKIVEYKYRNTGARSLYTPTPTTERIITNRREYKHINQRIVRAQKRRVNRSRFNITGGECAINVQQIRTTNKNRRYAPARELPGLPVAMFVISGPDCSREYLTAPTLLSLNTVNVAAHNKELRG